MNTVSKLEEKSMTRMQPPTCDDIKSESYMQDFHTPSSEEEEMSSNFCNRSYKVFWYSNSSQKVESTGDEPVTYTFGSNFHVLNSTYLRVKLPELRVSDQYKDTVRICWSHNVAHNIVRKATFMVGDTELPSFDNVWLDMNSQWLVKGDKDQMRHLSMGNVTFLEEWNNFLPSFSASFDQPFFYSRDNTSGYPLYLNKKPVKQVYIFRLEIAKLLRMQEKVSGTWTDIEIDMKKLTQKVKDIKTPELWARYICLSEEEINHEKCKAYHTMYVEDIISCDASNEQQYGSVVETGITCENPCRAFFWNAQNTTAAEFNNHSNYTTNSGNVYTGWSPLSLTRFVYGSSKKFTLEHDQTSRQEGMNMFPRCPGEQGYHAHAVSVDCLSPDRETGIIFADLGAKLSAKLENTNPFGLDRSQDKFQLLVRLLVIKKLCINVATGEISYS